MKKYTYYCPLRKEFESKSIEEKHRIECLNYLIDIKKIPKENIGIEKNLQIYGSAKKNNLIADIVVYQNNSNKELKNILYVVEVKANQKDKDKAIKYQLFPAIKLCPNLIYGIYWDEVNRTAFNKENNEISLVNINYKKETKQKEFLQLQKIKNTQSIWIALELCLRNHQGGVQNKHREILKLLLTKYYDEKFNQDNLVFNLERFDIQKIKDLYKTTLSFYGENIFDKILTANIDLNESCIKNCIKILQNYSLVLSDDKIIQEFYMKFAPSFLKKDLSQYYTPKEIANFMVSLVKINNTTKALDPSSGSGDFMVGILKKSKEENLNEVEKNIFCWDIDEDASALSQINMILNGDGRTQVTTKNSLENRNEQSNEYDLIITNPPFGVNTVYQQARGYDLKTIESGQLFVERSLILLKETGVLVIILPNGYLENPTNEPLRKHIINNSKIIGIINLPDNVFKCTGSGGKTSILILQKIQNKTDNYSFFIDRAEKVGFDHKSKFIPPLYKRNILTGSFLHNKENENIIENDLFEIKNRFDDFSKNGRNCFKMQYTDVLQSKYNRFCIRKYLPIYKQCVNKIKEKEYSNLADIGAILTNKKNYDIIPETQYQYIETGDIYRDVVLDVQKLRGWQLPNRAKLKVNNNCILLSKMDGTFNNFLYSKDNKIIASNGFYSIYIENEKDRFNFFRFIFTRDYITQMEALATGTIMADVKDFDLFNELIFPTNNKEDNFIQTQEYLTQKEMLKNFGI